MTNQSLVSLNTKVQNFNSLIKVVPKTRIGICLVSLKGYFISPTMS